MKVGDTVRLILQPPTCFVGDLAIAQVVSFHSDHIKVTVGDDLRPIRIDHGCYVPADESAKHIGGAE